MKKTLAELRQENKLSQRELAKILGVTPGTIGMYEIGLRTPSLKKAREIGEFFKISTDDIIFGKNTNESLTEVSNG